ncbi:uncharacterized protein LOC116026954 [Ipomoea triloba]|uniref:uncharacterized protein LOC116026954 n=1 Tax=Ipomoea triloba TaxID=35885 RepID=UPI00125D2C61|nr:uncharacterized protein LOC116026954 [Ipomoea triloba]
MEGFERRLQDLQDQFEGKVRPSAENLLTSSPFVDEIIDYRAPADLKIPKHATFDGTGDPREHLVSYQAKMQVLGVEEPLMCKAFLPTLKGLAQKWFLALPSYSIRCFNDLADRFLTHYAVNIKPQRNLTHLSGISQDEGEALKTYLARWQKEVQIIEGLDEQVAITFFMESLRAGKLFIDLHNDRPKTYVEAIQRASRQADTEEAVRQKRQREAAGSSAKQSRPDSRSRAEPERPSRTEVRRGAEPERPSRTEVRRGAERVGAPPPRLTVGAERVGAPPPRLTVAQPVHEVKDTLPPPPPLKPGDQPEILPPGRVPTKYCRYHRSTTHTTEECFYLRKEIEAMIQKGAPPPPNQWRRHPRSDKTDSRSDRGKQPASEEEETNWKHKPVINMIVGGLEGGDSSGSRKAWARQLYVGTIYGRDDSLKKVCREPILFTDEDLPRSQHPHRDALVIAMDVHGTVVRRVLVDTGSSVNILYLEVFERLGLQRDKLKPVKTPLAGFTGDSIESEGSIRLPVEIETFPNLRSIDMEFVVVNLSCSHNMILGRPGLEDLGALISLEHLCLKFWTPNGIGVARCDQKAARDCYLQSCRKIGKTDLRIHAITSREEQLKSLDRPEPAVELEEVEIDPSRLEKRVRIGVGLAEKVKQEIIQELQKYQKVFAWGPEDMPGVDRSVICHRLAVNSNHKPVIQKKRYLSADRREFVKKEVETLMAAQHIREVKYPDWLANVVLVPKPPAWRMCMYYTDLNQACPKDPFPLPRIDQLVDETASCDLLSFMDAFRGYHQIFMHPADEEKTAFITPDGVYCYRVMPFGLKNAGATYTRMVGRLFRDLLGKSMAAYVDDMLVKSKDEGTHARDLAATFAIMEK